MNGKGDKWRGGWSHKYANNHNKIFGDKMVDYKGRVLKIGERACIQEDIASVDGMLYKNTIVKIEAHKNNKIQVQDRSGKLWWVAYNQVSASFL